MLIWNTEDLSIGWSGNNYFGMTDTVYFFSIIIIFLESWKLGKKLNFHVQEKKKGKTNLQGFSFTRFWRMDRKYELCVRTGFYARREIRKSKFCMTSLNQSCYLRACFMIFGCQGQAIPPSCCWWGHQHGHMSTLRICSSRYYISLPSPQGYLGKERMEKKRNKQKKIQPTKRPFWGPRCVTSVFASCWGRFVRALQGGKVQVRGRKLLTLYRRRL